MYINLNGVLGTENCYVIYQIDELTFKTHNKVVIKIKLKQKFYLELIKQKIKIPSQCQSTLIKVNCQR